MLVTAALVAVLGCGTALASPIDYVGTVTISGSLNGQPFASSLVTLTVHADTDGIVTIMPGIHYNFGSMLFDIAGIGSGTLTDPSVGVATSGGNTCAFVDFTRITALFGAPCAQYDLSTDFSTSGFASSNPGFAFPTTAGLLVLDDGSCCGHLGNEIATFTATAWDPAPVSGQCRRCGTAGSALGERRPSRLVAAAAEDGLNFLTQRARRSRQPAIAPAEIAIIGVCVSSRAANKEKAPAARPGLGWHLCVTGGHR
jgi:hypothetical protein